MSSRLPSYRLHKPSGQAIVVIRKRMHYLGRFDSPESKAKYAQLIAKWVASGAAPPRDATAVDQSAASVAEVLWAYWEHAQSYYKTPAGKPSSELDNIRLALRPVRQLYGDTAPAAFDSLTLEAVRDEMIRRGLTRKRINKDIGRIKRCWKWAARKRLVPYENYDLMTTVEGLRAGRSGARETAPVKPVADDLVEATLPWLRPQHRAMVELQRATGMRPGEVIAMRGIDLDTSGPVWLYRPGSDQGEHGAHKTAWRGKDRVIALGPKAQEILKPWLRLNVMDYLFQPRESREAFDAERKAKRVSKVPPSQAKRTRKKRPKKTPADRYTVTSYTHAIYRAVIAAHCQTCEQCPRREDETRDQWAKRLKECQDLRGRLWSPNRLRHSFGTEVRRRYGLEAAQVLLGHEKANVTQVYAERDLALAVEVAKEIG